MTLTIRPATPADVPTMLGFVRDLAAFEKAPDAVEATEPMLHDALFGAQPAAEALIADLDGHAVGFAIFYLTFSTWTGKRGLWLDDLYIAPEARGQGVGAALLKALAGIAVDRGYARFEWWVLDWNTPAIDFYRAKGAVAQDEWTVQRVDGAALLALAGRG
ncbi:GNAT family N-acetyltransferase [Sphingomonas endophytica]|jgi:GNAT superfamily N-acetyltransferase|uniref:GNAT superfamily N-acetyltransferase n=1 Tax=Sphingomonas endophytica TaxID=869719 RepID=A0A7X0JBR9_9SPHN|nr:GNAT family N-acetyltransferase [Sphingomonas endophytica]MBB5727513.1 GNAT superfamily N-acetyltransferase [Sphingomonas endophytica]MBB6504704.1 GNAT superfamily N-acetyltransferase [Sphingomonas endophytica]